MTRPALVLLPAFPTDGRLYDGLRGQLDPPPITPDLPGFGTEPYPDPPPDVLSVSWLVDLLIERLEGIDPAGVVLGGCAIGGYLAIELTACRPDLVRALVLIGCKPAPDSPAMADARESVAQLALASGSAAVADRLVDQPLAPDAGPEVRGALRSMIEAADPRGIAGLVRGLARRPDPVPALRVIGVPTLVLCGERDPFTPPDQGRALAAMVPGARFVEVPGAGHLLPLERPNEVATELGRFLATLARDAAA